MESEVSEGNGRVRIQFDMSAPALQRLDLLKDRLGCSTRAEVVRRALALFDRMSEEGIVEVKITGADGTPRSFDPQSVLRS